MDSLWPLLMLVVMMVMNTRKLWLETTGTVTEFHAVAGSNRRLWLWEAPFLSFNELGLG